MASCHFHSFVCAASTLGLLRLPCVELLGVLLMPFLDLRNFSARLGCGELRLLLAPEQKERTPKVSSSALFLKTQLMIQRKSSGDNIQSGRRKRCFVPRSVEAEWAAVHVQDRHRTTTDASVFRGQRSSLSLSDHHKSGETVIGVCSFNSCALHHNKMLRGRRIARKQTTL